MSEHFLIALICLISYNEEGRFLHFTANIQLGLQDFENLFFQTLLEPVIEEAACRHITGTDIFPSYWNSNAGPSFG